MRSLHTIVEAEVNESHFVLKPFSETAVQIRQVVSAPDFEFAELEKLILTDVAISAEVLKVSNSVLYSQLGEVKSIQQALTRLGANEIMRIALIASYRENFLARTPIFKLLLTQLWKHSVQCSNATAWVMHQISREVDETASTFAGLFHDIGKLVILVALDNALQQQPRRTLLPSEIVSFINEYHEAYGAAFLRKWEFPEEYAVIANRHHTPFVARPDTKNKLLNAVCFANAFAKTFPEWIQKEDGTPEEICARYQTEHFGEVVFDPALYEDFYKVLSAVAF